MAGIRTIPINATTETTEGHHLFTLLRVRQCPHTKTLIPEAESFRARIDAAKAEERTLIEADMEASAAVHFADRELDDSASFVAANVDLKSLLGTRLFGDQRPRDFRRPLLGAQIDAMKGWPAILTESGKDVLVAHVPLLSQRVDAGVIAAESKTKASANLANFRAVGTRVKLNEAFNAWRKALYGKLGDMQHANPALGTGWAESFFMQESDEEPTLLELDRKIAAAELDLERLKKHREQLKAQEEAAAAARAAATRKEKQAKLDALRKAQAEIEEKAATLAAEIEAEP